MNFAIYPVSWADMHKDQAGQKYQPSNGTEGEIFIDAWCSHCARDKALSEGLPIEECDDDQLCKIVAHTMAFDVDDSRYPHEWQYGKDGQPCCTAFVHAGDQIPPAKDTHTTDMFTTEVQS